MTNNSQKRPSPEQLNLLRKLARERGESFGYPATFGDASREIKRLLARRRRSGLEHRVERDQLDRVGVSRGDATAVRESEIVGFGSSARWAGR